MTRLKYKDPADGQWKLLPVGGGGSGTIGQDEVFVGTTDPGTGAWYELWYDTDAVDPYYGQGVMRFANAAARTAALPSPVEGMVTYLLDVHQLQYYNGSIWLSPVIGTTVPAFRGRRTSGPESVAAGQNRRQVDFTTEKVLHGGITESVADRTMVVPYAGVYQMSAGATFLNIVAGTSVQAVIGDLSAPYIWGSSHSPLANGYAFSVASGIIALNAGAKVSLWTQCDQACYIETSVLYISHIGNL